MIEMAFNINWRVKGKETKVLERLWIVISDYCYVIMGVNNYKENTKVCVNLDHLW